jgi:hypothetical protein
VPLEYSIVWVICVVTCGLEAVTVGWPGAPQDRLPAGSPSTQPFVLLSAGNRVTAVDLVFYTRTRQDKFGMWLRDGHALRHLGAENLCHLAGCSTDRWRSARVACQGVG